MGVSWHAFGVPGSGAEGSAAFWASSWRWLKGVVVAVVVVVVVAAVAAVVVAAAAAVAVAVAVAAAAAATTATAVVGRGAAHVSKGYRFLGFWSHRQPALHFGP